ncbi:hypothetical protein SNE40_015140 [Patella caerulea]|uniref:P2X purinoreceptor 7 intracellular domain-containing protein n=1 Tax=Patella caerulea TaxID=87958 RepID=A0AAN8PK87_PATCE
MEGKRNICCLSSKYSYKVLKEDNLKSRCITLHPKFKTRCLQNAEIKSAMESEETSLCDINQKCRYIAYRYYVRWIVGTLGEQSNTGIVPLCVHRRVEEKFPPI